MQTRILFVLGLSAMLLAALAWPFDHAVSLWFQSLRSDGLSTFFLTLSDSHDTLMTLAAVAVLALCLERRWALLLVLAVPGGMLLNVLIKWLVRRSRPQFEHPLVELFTYSFPSGHTVSATLLYGVLAVWLARRSATALAVIMVALVALSRLYLGAHYLSDVLAAIGEGCLWLMLCMIMIRKRLPHWPQR